jgi:hypothetical protein
LHQPRWRQLVKDDMAKIPQLLEQVDSIAEMELPRDAKQLNLF